jgi:hypothetical protein
VKPVFLLLIRNANRAHSYIDPSQKCGKIKFLNCIVAHFPCKCGKRDVVRVHWCGTMLVIKSTITEGRATFSIDAVVRRHQDDLGPLPEGWEERVHTDGRIFFIDHNTR